MGRRLAAHQAQTGILAKWVHRVTTAVCNRPQKARDNTGRKSGTMKSVPLWMQVRVGYHATIDQQ